MQLTHWLYGLIALLAIAGGWRLARWYWRPRLRLPADVSLEPVAGGVRLFLEIRNAGAARSRGCRATLIRCERREGNQWVRVDAPPAGTANDPIPPGIAPRRSARVCVDRLVPTEPGRYRIEVAVLNGEERRGSYVVEVGEARVEVEETRG